MSDPGLKNGDIVIPIEIIGEKTKHKTFGVGTIEAICGKFIDVCFEQVGMKRLGYEICLKNNILEFMSTELNGQQAESKEIKKNNEEFWTEYISSVENQYFIKGPVYKCWKTEVEGIWGHYDQKGNVHFVQASRFRRFERAEWWMLTQEEQDEEERKFIDRVSLEVIDELQPDSKKQIIDNPDDDYHYGLGLYIRNKYIHGKEDEFLFTMFHADHLSGKIIDRIIERLMEGQF